MTSMRSKSGQMYSSKSLPSIYCRTDTASSREYLNSKKKICSRRQKKMGKKNNARDRTGRKWWSFACAFCIVQPECGSSMLKHDEWNIRKRSAATGHAMNIQDNEIQLAKKIQLLKNIVQLASRYNSTIPHIIINFAFFSILNISEVAALRALADEVVWARTMLPK